MQIILKVIAAPFALTPTITVAVSSFLRALSVGVLSVLASLAGRGWGAHAGHLGGCVQRHRPAGDAIQMLKQLKLPLI